MTDLCEHNTFNGICAICHRDNIIARLRTEVERAGRDWNTVRDTYDGLVLEFTRLRAENERLKRSRDRYRVAWQEEKRRFTEARAAMEEK